MFLNYLELKKNYSTKSKLLIVGKELHIKVNQLKNIKINY